MFVGTIVDARVVSDKAFTRTGGENTITKIRVADNPSRKADRTPCRFVNAEAWGKTGTQLAKLAKGDVVSLTGELKLDKYTDKNGTERTDDVLTVTSFRVQKSTAFFEAAAEIPDDADVAPKGKKRTKTQVQETVDDDALPDPDDDLPF